MSFRVERRVEFRDTDAAGIAHFSVFFPMMEAAEHDALRHVGLSVMQPMADGSHLTWPRVSASCQYHRPARFEDRLEIEVAVESLGTTSVLYAFRFLRDDELIATGELTAVCCLWTPGEGLEKRPIPDDIRSALQRLS